MAKPSQPDRLAAAIMPQDEANRLAQLFQALSDPYRVRILGLLYSTGELSVSRLSELLQQSQPAMSHHLTQLRLAGIITFRREGKFNYYHLDVAGIQELLDTHSNDGPLKLSFAGFTMVIKSPNMKAN